MTDDEAVTPAPGPEERRLVRDLVRDHDEAAFRALYRAHAGPLYAVALRMTGGSEADAQDVLQEAWRRAIAGLEGFRHRSGLRSWLRTIVVRCALEALRARRRALGTDDVERLPAPPARAPEERIDLRRAFEALPDGYRTVLVLHDVEGYTHAEIAEMLGVHEGTSKSQLARARAWMRDAMSEEEG